MSSVPLKVDIWSDIACPWCYIGKRKFEAAVAESGVPVEVEYHSFELSPGTPAEYAHSHDEFLAGHLGVSREQAAAMGDRVTGIAATVGLNYDYARLQTTNTVLGHQAIHYAKAHGKQAQMKERLMKAYFEEGRHVGRIPELADLAAEIGLDRDDVVRSLTAGEYLGAVRADVALAGELGIRGVPFFVLDGKYGISGAQESATFAQALEQVAAEHAGDVEQAS
ncbi:DsbA family protein [Pseudolysinimonas yzui]|uniref:DSBA oxidoreductase n=1 Tax=Pseudolysinimonas yzui TaxID=2708254 RepID=A0A8J3GT35_9MICO|nr:DsbA family oxidoreductase [Pseudolysinimonas yzui]GHF26126.1 DSBA oxidoreductase [Pseudolysinimonas yzui]